MTQLGILRPAQTWLFKKAAICPWNIFSTILLIGNLPKSYSPLNEHRCVKVSLTAATHCLELSVTVCVCGAAANRAADVRAAEMWNWWDKVASQHRGTVQQQWWGKKIDCCEWMAHKMYGRQINGWFVTDHVILMTDGRRLYLEMNNRSVVWNKGRYRIYCSPSV